MKKKLIGLAIIAGAVVAAAKLVVAKKAEWQGLNETEVREKVGQSLPSRVPDEKRAEVADKVVAKMRERGMLEEDAEPVAEREAAEIAEAVPAEETSEDASEDDSEDGSEQGDKVE